MKSHFLKETKITVYCPRYLHQVFFTFPNNIYLQCLKKLRHPSVLRYFNSCVTGEHIYIFVEYVRPLKSALDSQSALEICCGLQNILVALDFIHSKVTLLLPTST